jgi:ER-bound oxygenase mpaB/B'/Rubber oxygenase, catalytic domain
MSTVPMHTGDGQVAVEGKHPFDYYYRPGMDLRPLPPRVGPAPAWIPLRRLLFSPFMRVEDEPALTPITSLAADHLWQGDELMDAVVLMFKRVGPKEGRAMLDQALDDGIESLENPPAELIAYFAHLDNPPPWHDPDVFERGRVLYATATPFGTVGAFLFDAVMNALYEEVSAAVGATGRTSRDPVLRNAEAFHWLSSVSQPGSMDRYSDPFKNTVRVRLMHAQVRYGLRRTWGDEVFAESGNPITTSSMAIAIGVLGLSMLLIDHGLGRRRSREDRDAVTMFWSYVVYVLGVPDELIPKNADEAMELADFMLATAGRPTEWSADIAGGLQTLLDALVEGINSRVLRACARRVTPFVYGYMSYIVGEELAREFTRGLPAEHCNLKRWSQAAHVVAVTVARVAAVRDRLPGADERARWAARDGSPLQNIILRLMNAATARRNGSPAYTFAAHDKTNQLGLVN